MAPLKETKVGREGYLKKIMLHLQSYLQILLAKLEYKKTKQTKCNK